MRTCALLLACALLGQNAGSSPASVRRVAITIDDGPVVGEPEDLEAFHRVSRGLIDSLRAEGAPATIFVNERQLNVPGQRDGRASVLEWWLDAGFDLGNHTYSHPSLNGVPFRDFADDVVKGEVISRPLIEKRGRRLLWFRYPFLHSGTTAEVHDQIMAFLAERGYRAAPVTVDYADYAFAGVYRAQLRSGAADTASKIADAYLTQVDAGFDYAERASLDVFGREIAQILLIHCNELNARTLRESLARIRARGYQFITLDEAMRDAAYDRPDSFAGPGGTWLTRSAAVLGRTISVARPPMPPWITELAGRGNRTNR